MHCPTHVDARLPLLQLLCEGTILQESSTVKVFWKGGLPLGTTAGAGPAAGHLGWALMHSLLGSDNGWQGLLVHVASVEALVLQCNHFHAPPIHWST